MYDKLITGLRKEGKKNKTTLALLNPHWWRSPLTVVVIVRFLLVIDEHAGPWRCDADRRRTSICNHELLSVLCGGFILSITEGAYDGSNLGERRARAALASSGLVWLRRPAGVPICCGWVPLVLIFLLWCLNLVSHKTFVASLKSSEFFKSTQHNSWSLWALSRYFM